ncbi:hypothetical protein EVAR_21227_1 [Eumeta japonica]|uniref:Uncharacterized protein n=1 Tax=Eumeta variegata TaxID=151549 RepID=A0A4C1UNT5_EUMVA|nr:hypothetical protein EVAR_21227_1 [Eumeta japonica]
MKVGSRTQATRWRKASASNAQTPPTHGSAPFYATGIRSEAEDEDSFKVVKFRKCLNKRVTRLQRYSQFSSNSIPLELNWEFHRTRPYPEFSMQSNRFAGIAEPRPSFGCSKIGTSVFEKAAFSKSTDVKPVASPKAKPPPPSDEVKTDLVNQGFPICSGYRLHRRDGRSLSQILAVLNKTESAKEMRKISLKCIAYRASLLSLHIKSKDPGSAIGVKTMGIQLLTAMPNPDV